MNSDRLSDQSMALWDSFAMEYFKMFISDRFGPETTAQNAYTYANAMMKEREIQIAALFSRYKAEK